MFFEDVLPNAQIFAKIKSFSVCWQNLYFYRLSADSITRKMFSEQKINDFFEVYEQTYSFLQQTQIYPKVQSKFVTLVQNCFNYYLKQIPEHAKADYLSRLSSFIQRISHA